MTEIFRSSYPLHARGVELETSEAPPGCSFGHGIIDYARFVAG